MVHLRFICPLILLDTTEQNEARPNGGHCTPLAGANGVNQPLPADQRDCRCAGYLLPYGQMSDQQSELVSSPIRIAFVITGVTAGGAEAMLIKLLSRLDRSRFTAQVWTLRRGGEMEQHFRALGFPLHMIGQGRLTTTIMAPWRLLTLTRRFRPHLIQGWMYHGNLAANLASLAAPAATPLLWNVRHSLSALDGSNRSTRALMWLSGKLSAWPQRIINNSLTSATRHESQLGYPQSKRVIIPNGFDTDLFKPSRQARQQIRLSLGVADETILVGVAARFDYVKNHRGFLRAAAAVLRQHEDVQFLLVGADIDQRNRPLLQWIEELGLRRHTHLLGHRDDMPAVQASLDLSVCCSFSEGFPNVVGEAMSCGVPCLVTDVGASAQVVGDAGSIIPANDQLALEQALSALLALPSEQRRALGERARQRVIQLFSLDTVALQYANLYYDCVRQPERTAAALRSS